MNPTNSATVTTCYSGTGTGSLGLGPPYLIDLCVLHSYLIISGLGVGVDLREKALDGAHCLVVVVLAQDIQEGAFEGRVEHVGQADGWHGSAMVLDPLGESSLKGFDDGPGRPSGCPELGAPADCGELDDDGQDQVDGRLVFSLQKLRGLPDHHEGAEHLSEGVQLFVGRDEPFEDGELLLAELLQGWADPYDSLEGHHHAVPTGLDWQDDSDEGN